MPNDNDTKATKFSGFLIADPSLNNPAYFDSYLRSRNVMYAAFFSYSAVELSWSSICACPAERAVSRKGLDMPTNDHEIELAIKALLKVASDNELMGYGTLPPAQMRVEATTSLGTYVPHRKAIEALEDIMSQSWAPDEVRVAAARALALRR